MYKILIALATLTLLASCTMPGATPPPVAPTKQMAPDAMMPKADTIEQKDTMMKDDKMMMSGSDSMQMDNKKMPDAMPLPAQPAGVVIATDTMEKPADTMMKKETGYQSYTPELVTSALKNNQKVVLFFAASWCPTCKALNTTITSDLSAILADTLILRVNYDDSTALKQKYGVVTQHTTVVLNSDGTLASKKIGARTVAEVISK